MHGVAILYHILCTNELDVHITAKGVCTPGNHNLVYIEIVRQYAPIADQISQAATFIIDLIQKTATNADGDMCAQKMKAHITDATKLQTKLTAERQAGLLTEKWDGQLLT